MNKVLLDVIISVTKSVTMGVLDIFAEQESSRKSHDNKAEEDRKKRKSNTKST